MAMQPFDPAGVYSVDDVKAALTFQPGRRSIRFAYERQDSTGVSQGDLETVLAGTIKNNSLADIKRTGTFSLVDDGTVNYLSDRIKPRAILDMSDGGTVSWPLGVFLLSTPERQREVEGYVTREVEAYDLLLQLRDDKVTDRYTVASGTAYTTAIATLATSAGIPAASQNITPSASTLPAALEWDPGTSKLRIMNDLANAINYESTTFDANGIMVCRPYLSPQVRASEYDYALDASSIISGKINQTLDLFSVPNRFVLVKAEPDQPALRSVYNNTTASSPTSQTSRGRVIADVETEQEAANQATLDALAARRAFEASQVYESVEFNTALLPLAGNADVITLTVAELALDVAKYSEVEWSMPLKAGGIMSHRARRVVNV